MESVPAKFVAVPDTPTGSIPHLGDVLLILANIAGTCPSCCAAIAAVISGK